MSRQIAVTMTAILISLALPWAHPAQADSLTGGGTWQSNSGAAIRGEWSATLVRSDSTVSGEFVIHGSPLFKGGTTEGSLTDDDIVLGVIVSDSAQARFRGKLNGQLIEGDWELPEINDTGTWEGTLK